MRVALRTYPAINLILFLVMLLTGQTHGADADLAESLHSHLEHSDASQRKLEGESLQSYDLLQRFYQMRDYQPAWLDHSGLAASALELKQALLASREQGLEPANYHMHAILLLLEQLTSKPMAMTDQLAAELLFTDAYLLLARDYLHGRLKRKFQVPAWRKLQPEINLAAYLTLSLEQGRVRQDLLDLLPQSIEYQGLVQALNHYRVIAHLGAWSHIDNGPKLEPGDRGERVAQLRSRLQAEQYLPTNSRLQTDLFDNKLEQAVRRFQTHHGLAVDGIVGRATLPALNVPVSQRIEQIRINLERLRWLPRQLSPKSIRVNIADFQLLAREYAETVLEMKIIVGKPYRQTPEFSEQMTYLVLNPSWYVPRRIALRDKLPLIEKDPTYLGRNGYVLYKRGAESQQVIDPTTVDWQNPKAKTFPYRLRQIPGANNALGRIKFMLPNRFNVYLHDTPDRELFTRTKRTFSSGCIRLARPLQLAVWVMQGNPDWDQQALEQAIAKGRERVVKLPQPIPVDMIYLTAWGSAEGSAQFREDIYRRDAKVAETLDRPL